MKLWHLVSAFALLAEPFVVAELAYCATDNTGSSFSAVTDTYQSNGACQKTCAKYALGVLQGKKCWCTNVVPSKSSQKSTSKCDTSCPGYPSDSCGSAADGVFAYVSAGSKSPTSTEDSSGGTTSTSGTSGTSMSTTTSSQKSTTTSSSSDTTTTTGNIVKETTSGGQVKTITVAGSSATAGADASTAKAADDDNSGLSGGAIAGVVIGVIGGLALLGGLIFLVFFYRKRARAASPVPSNGDMAENRTSQGSSFIRGGVFPQGSDPQGNGLGRQNTYTDNRMKNVYPGHGSRDSSVSLQDNEDYSRPVLRLANPD